MLSPDFSFENLVEARCILLSGCIWCWICCEITATLRFLLFFWRL